MELLDLITIITDNFNFAYMISINILTYIIIKIIDKLNGEKAVSTNIKRLILLVAIIIITIIYKLNNFDDNIILLNSAILSPVFYSWVIRPILKKLNIGYKEFDKYLK